MMVYALTVIATITLSAGATINVEKVAVIFSDKSACENWAALGPRLMADSRVECRPLPFIDGTTAAPAR